jgi:hypothetical protein
MWRRSAIFDDGRHQLASDAASSNASVSKYHERRVAARGRVSTGPKLGHEKLVYHDATDQGVAAWAGRSSTLAAMAKGLEGKRQRASYASYAGYIRMLVRYVIGTFHPKHGHPIREDLTFFTIGPTAISTMIMSTSALRDARGAAALSSTYAPEPAARTGVVLSFFYRLSVSIHNLTISQPVLPDPAICAGSRAICLQSYGLQHFGRYRVARSLPETVPVRRWIERAD